MTYRNSKGQLVVIVDMPDTYLLNAIRKLDRDDPQSPVREKLFFELTKRPALLEIYNRK